MVATLLPVAPGAFAATDSLTLTPAADAWVNSGAPTTNYGSSTTLKARVNLSETYLRFNLTAWQGLRISALKLTLTGLSGNMSPLRLSTTGLAWTEAGVTWATRPAVVAPLSAVPTVSNGKATFDVKALFPSGFVNATGLSLRVATPNDTVVTFASRETSSSKPTLTLVVASRTDTVDLPPTGDTWADSTASGTNYGTATSLQMTSGVKREAYLKFDLSAWTGRPYTALKLRLRLTAPTGPSVNVYKVSPSWHEASLTWANRPTGGTLLGTFGALDVGTRALDVSSAFASRTVEQPVLAVRLVGVDVATMTVASRETGTPPVLRLFPGTTVAPPPSPTPSPTPTATAAPSPTPAPTGAPSPTPAPTGEPIESFYFEGYGTDHGAGMSQTGAKGRANAGQMYEQIIHAYYTGVTLAPLPPGKETIRVQLAASFVPTATEPARVVARSGAWQSEAFPEQVFPADTYLDMVVGESGTWLANVRDATGEVLASTESMDLTMTPAEPTTVFYMKFRDSLRKYDLYRGSMRLRVNGAGVQAINIVSMEHYVQGVVAGEMIPSWPLEALKVQAVAARSYGAAKIKTTGFYDVVPTSANQVYGGVNLEFTKTNNATAGTAGLIIWNAEGRVASAFFFDTAGGHTESSEYTWPTNSGSPGQVIPHIRGIADVDENGVPYDSTAANYSWQSGQFTMAQLSSILAKDSRTNVGTILDFTFYRGVSGRVYKATLVGTGGTKNVSGAIFKNAFNNHRPTGMAGLKSTAFHRKPVP